MIRNILSLVLVLLQLYLPFESKVDNTPRGHEPIDPQVHLAEILQQLEDPNVDPSNVEIQLSAAFQWMRETYKENPDYQIMIDEYGAIYNMLELEQCRMVTWPSSDKEYIRAYTLYNLIYACRLNSNEVMADKYVQAILDDDTVYRWFRENSSNHFIALNILMGDHFVDKQEYEKAISYYQLNMKEKIIDYGLEEGLFYDIQEGTRMNLAYSYEQLCNAVMKQLEKSKTIAGTLTATEDRELLGKCVYNLFCYEDYEPSGFYERYLLGAYYMHGGFYEDAIRIFDEVIAQLIQMNSIDTFGEALNVRGRAKALYLSQQIGAQECLDIFLNAPSFDKELDEGNTVDHLLWCAGMSLAVGEESDFENYVTMLEAMEGYGEVERGLVSQWRDWTR